MKFWILAIVICLILNMVWDYALIRMGSAPIEFLSKPVLFVIESFIIGAISGGLALLVFKP